MGRLDIEQKGLDMLIPAVASLGSNAKNLGIVLVGPEWKGSESRIREMIRENKIEDSFHLYGPAYGNEKFDLMKASDAFLYPSRWEGLPFAVVEAMAVGQLCLVTPASDPAGLLAKEGGGVVCPSTIEGIREGLVECMNLSADKRTSLLQISADIVRDHMTWNVIGRIIEKSYYKVLKSD